jgi:hypothetical protein
MSETFEADVEVAHGAVSISGSGTARALSGVSGMDTVDTKIMADLDMLMEKMDLCDAMILKPSSDSPAPSVRTDEACQSVIGFLEACAPRMVELVEAAAQGAVTDMVLMKALEVNDRLTKQLADIDTTALTETPASTTAAAAPVAASSSRIDANFADAAADNLDDLLLSDDGDSDLFGDSKAPAVATKSTGEEEEVIDPFGNNVLQPTSASAPVEPASAKSEDDFDSFFNDRTTS